MASCDKASVEALCRAAVHSHSLRIWALRFILHQPAFIGMLESVRDALTRYGQLACSRQPVLASSRNMDRSTATRLC